MITFLDLLIIVFAVLTALSLLATSLMFLVNSPRVRKVCFYIVVALGLYVCSISIRVMGSLFPEQLALGVGLGIMSLAALVLERVSKGDAKKFKIARILAAVALLGGIINAFS